jgi:hypothetical protein
MDVEIDNNFCRTVLKEAAAEDKEVMKTISTK